MIVIKKPVAPRLPTSPFEYQQKYQDQFNNILRLYFNQLDSVNTNLLDPQGGQFLNFPYGSFYSSVNQNPAAINTAYGVTFNNTVYSYGMSVGSPTSRIVIEYPGAYNFQFSLQLDKTTGGLANIYVWARVNGTDIAQSASRIHIQGNNNEVVAAWNFVLQMSTANSYFELMWAVTDVTAILLAEGATAFSPAIPSAILTVTYVSSLPST